MDEKKRQVPCTIEEIHSRIQYLGRKGEFGECQGDNWGIWEGISVRYRRYKKTRERKRNI